MILEAHLEKKAMGIILLKLENSLGTSREKTQAGEGRKTTVGQVSHNTSNYTQDCYSFQISKELFDKELEEWQEHILTMILKI